MMELFKDTAEERCFFETWMLHPDKIETMERLRVSDKEAERAIKDAERSIEKLKEYRRMLYDRAQKLDRAEKRKLVEIIKEKTDGKISYTVSVYDVAQDGTRHGYEAGWYHMKVTGSMKELSRTVYGGKERRKALADFEQLLKEYPGAMTIDKREG